MIAVGTSSAMEQAGVALAPNLLAGDVVCLNGALGAGKTTMVRGLARGMGVTERVSSPTFVIARRHVGAGVDLVHGDAYRIGGEDEFADLGLDAEDAIVVLEWGDSYAALLSDDWLKISIQRSEGSGDEVRFMEVTGYGERWNDASIVRLVEAIEWAVKGADDDPGD